jgi:hypothetical protein
MHTLRELALGGLAVLAVTGAFSLRFALALTTFVVGCERVRAPERRLQWA